MKNVKKFKQAINFILVNILAFAVLSSCSKSTNVITGKVEPSPVIVLPAKPEGCTIDIALNFDKLAEVDSGTCEFEGCLIFDSSLKEAFEKYKSNFAEAQLNNTCPAQQVDIFNQNNRAHTGILWVIDDSGSMRLDQENLATNFNSFINSFKTKDINFTMGITTTSNMDPLKRKVIPAEDILTSEKLKQNETTFVQDFTRLIEVGIDGSGKEQGFASAQEYLASSSGKLLESKSSYLNVIYVSDENDFSTNISAQENITDLKKYVEKSEKLRIHSIVDQVSPQTSSASKGTKYIEASQLQNGVNGDINSNNFANVLKNLGDSISDLITNFKLKTKPYLPSLEVKVNGEILSDTKWEYNENTQSIIFSEAPSESAEIQVTYLPRQ